MNDQSCNNKFSLHNKYKRHTSSVAFNFEVGVTAKGVHTINIESAGVVQTEGNQQQSFVERHYHWENKVLFQLSSNELLLFTAVLLNIKNSCTFDNHGSEHDKHLLMQYKNPNRLFLTLKTRNSQHNVWLHEGDLFYLSGIAINQIIKNTQATSWVDIISLIRNIYGRDANS